MKYDLDRSELNRQIMMLLSYDGVAPLAASAIAINLAVGDDEIRASLEVLKMAGKIASCADGRYYRLSAIPSVTVNFVNPCREQGGRKAG